MQYDPELAAGTDDLEEVGWLSLAGKRFEQGMASEGEKEAKEEAKRVILAAEPLLTVAMDLAAQEQEYKAGD